MDERLRAFEEAAIEWAATGCGQPLVDAAAEALADGFDTPALRLLAGATRRQADEDAREFGPPACRELGVPISDPYSPGAYRDYSQLLGRRFLAGVLTEREFVRQGYRCFVNAEWPDELADFATVDSRYALADDGIVWEPEPDRAARELAERLAAGIWNEPEPSGGTATAPQRGGRSWVRRWLRRGRRSDESARH